MSSGEVPCLFVCVTENLLDSGRAGAIWTGTAGGSNHDDVLIGDEKGNHPRARRMETSGDGSGVRATTCGR